MVKAKSSAAGSQLPKIRPAKNLKAQEAKTASLIFEPRPDWHAHDLPNLPLRETIRAVPTFILTSLHDHAKSLLEGESARFESTRMRSSSSHKFMSTIMTSGTWSDKVSALTLVVQESPLHNFKTLENLINLARKRSRTQALMALGALKDLSAQGSLLPGDRKLRFFQDQPALLSGLQSLKSWTPEDPFPGGVKNAHLIFWAFEDLLKRSYFEVLKILEIWSNDEVEFARIRAVTFVWELLKEKPEQEENLLRLLVNKLGDTSKKVASRASHLLLQLQVSHPSMKSVIVDCVESEILLRPGQNSHAKYYAMITLNQTVLQTGHPEVASRLLDVYFGLFVSILNKSKSKKRKRELRDEQSAEQEIDDKIVAQVLTGVNRAFPFSKKDSDTFEKHLDTLFRITHSSNFNTSIQALVLIQQISATHHMSTDRFMRTLYESLLDPRLFKSSKHTMYLNLLYRSLKSDASIRRVKAFVKRMLQILAFHEPPFICSMLFLVFELQHIFPGLKSMLDEPELPEDEEEAFKDVPEDSSIERAQPERGHNSNIGLGQKLYDGRKRDPEHSNADRTCLWELSPWLNHYHPSTVLFAQHILSSVATSENRAKAPAKPDPTSHTLSHFLDRFVYRQPKTRADANMRGTSLMQPALAASNTADSLFVSSSGAGPVAEPQLNSEAFWKKRVEEINPDEVFFHKYFSSVHAGKPKKASKQKSEGDVDDDGFDEEEVWKALVSSQPELDGADESDDEEEGDFDMSGDDLSIDDESDGGASFNMDDDDEAPLDLEDEEGSALFDSGSEAEEPKIEEDEEESKDKKPKKRIRNLPTFAAVEDYAQLLEQEDSDGEGFV